MPKTALVILADGFETIEALTTVDVLRRAEIELTVAGLGQQTITSAHGVPVTTDCLLESITETPDLLVLPGGMPGAANLGASATARELTTRTLEAGKLCAAICAAPAKTLAAWGLLDGRRATCFPGCEAEFSSGVTFCEDRVVVDGNIITSRGAGTAMEFSLMLVECMQDAEYADALATRMLARR